MAWLTPKTDWTSSDYYTYDALNRVESNTDEVLSKVNTVYGSVPSTDPSITNRTTLSIEFQDSLNRIESNLLAIKNFLHEPVGWIPPITTWVSRQVFDYVDANRLEVNILLLYDLISGSENTLPKCGNFRCGQDRYNL